MRTRKKSLFWLPIALAASALSLPLAAPARVDLGPASNAIGVVEYPIPTANSRPYTIVAGPDGNLWFTESTSGAIGRITPSGVITEFPLPNPKSNPYGITRGADGNLWFTERLADRIGKITPSGVITEYPVLTPNAQPWDITALPDGTFWFTEENVDQIGRIDQAGNVTEYPAGKGTFPTHITTGPDGNIWYTEELGNHIVRLNPNNPSERTRFPLLTDGCAPVGHRSRPRRESVVHHARRARDRKDHAGGGRHRIHGAGQVRDRRHRSRSGRPHVVHRERLGAGGLDHRRRAGRDGALRHRVVPVCDHRRAGPEHVVLRGLRQRDRQAALHP